MKTKTIITYNFSELSEKAKQNAINKNYDCNTFIDWWDHIYDDAKSIGLKITGFNINRERNAQGDFIETPYQVATLIRANHGLETETYGTAFCYTLELEQQANNIESQTKKDPKYDPDFDLSLAVRRSETEKWFLNQLLQDYAIILEKEFYHQTSKESIIETIEANEYQFLENGELA